jgi:hypothetical protein
LLDEVARLLRQARDGHAQEAGAADHPIFRRLARLSVRIRGGLADAADFRRARAELTTLSLPAGAFAVALNRLDNARRYLFDDEPGAAACELRLLAGLLREAGRRSHNDN